MAYGICAYYFKIIKGASLIFVIKIFVAHGGGGEGLTDKPTML